MTLDKYIEIYPDVNELKKELYIPAHEYSAILLQNNANISIADIYLNEGKIFIDYFSVLFGIDPNKISIKSVELSGISFRDALYISSIDIQSIKKVFDLFNIMVIDKTDDLLTLLVNTQSEIYQFKSDRNTNIEISDR